jgi:hypothetical protein
VQHDSIPNKSISRRSIQKLGPYFFIWELAPIFDHHVFPTNDVLVLYSFWEANLLSKLLCNFVLNLMFWSLLCHNGFEKLPRENDLDHELSRLSIR